MTRRQFIWITILYNYLALKMIEVFCLFADLFLNGNCIMMQIYYTQIKTNLNLVDLIS